MLILERVPSTFACFVIAVPLIVQIFLQDAMKSDLVDALHQLTESLQKTNSASENFTELLVSRLNRAYLLVRNMIIIFMVAGYHEGKYQCSLYSSRARSHEAASSGEPHQKLLHS